MNKDYYQILGVLDDAEDVVIRAAYRALAQRYHPDKWEGSIAEAHKRMADLNEAYEVLSDSHKRQKYDSSRSKSEYQNDNFTDADLNRGIEDRWQSAVEYYPDLQNIVIRLSKISSQLVGSYKLTLLEKKEFERRSELALAFENTFLKKYFGSNEEIISYAKKIILLGNKDAAKELNKAVEILGSGANPYTIINKINEKFFPFEVISRKYNIEKAKKYLSNRTTGNASALIREVGGKVELGGIFATKFDVNYNSQSWTLNSEDLLILADTIAKNVLS
jgi:curved DNA-binding protein CbpA